MVRLRQPQEREKESADRAARKDKINAERRAKYRADPQYRERRRGYNNRYAYGISCLDREDLLVRQGGVCAICREPANPLCIDHCHISGQVRGLLCNQCNLGLGIYRDDPARLRSAADYLERVLRDPSAR
jgi:hypothetical protein